MLFHLLAVFIYTAETEILGNPTGLINITCDKLTYEHFIKCIEQSDADHGSYTDTPGAYFTYTFIGTRVHILAYKQTESQNVHILIDDTIDENKAIVNLNSYGNNRAEIVYSSEELAFGQHTIRLNNAGAHNEYIVIGSIYIDPIKKDLGGKLSFQHFHIEEGQWSEDRKKTPPIFSSNSEQASGYFEFIGDRFWLTGVRGRDVGALEIIIDDGIPIPIDESNGDGIAQNNYPILLYQSDQLQFGQHKVRVRKTTQRISLVNLIYSYPEPNSVPVSIGTDMMNIIGERKCTVDITCDNHEITSNCGKRCWKSGTGTTSFSYTFKGERFQIYGTLDPNHTTYSIYLDNELLDTFSQRGTRTQYHLDYTSTVIPYGVHTIRAEGTTLFEIYKFAFWPSILAKRTNITDFKKSSPSNWIKQSDGIGGIWEYTNNANTNHAATTDIGAKQFWIYGSLDKNHQSANVIFGSIQDTFNEHILNDSRYDMQLVYESGKFEYHPGEFAISTQEVILIHCIYFVEEEPVDMPISVGLENVAMSGGACSPEVVCSNEEISNQLCGKRCWKDKGADKFTLTYTFEGEKFQVYGTRDPVHLDYNVYVDDKILANINQKGIRQYSIMQFSSNILPYGAHTIRIESTNTFEIYKIAFWPSILARRVNITEFAMTGTWHKESDGIGGIRMFSDKDKGRATASISIGASQIWVYGTFDPGHGNCEMTFSHISTTINQQQSPRRNTALLYKSEKFEYSFGELKFDCNNPPFLLNYIYHIYNPPPPTASFLFSSSISFTNSELFSNSKQFSGSIEFSDSQLFTTSISFTSSNLFSLSLSFTNSDQFSDSIKFSGSNEFSKSISFTSSNLFSLSLSFTNSDQFSDSIKFSGSNEFSESMQFSDSTPFTSHFFSTSNQFSNSKVFSLSELFSQSNVFSVSNLFSNSRIFSISRIFSESNLFSTMSFTSSVEFTPELDIGAITSGGEPGGKVASKNSIGITIGVVVGVIVLIAIIAIILIILYVRRKANAKKSDKECSCDTGNHSLNCDMNRTCENGKLDTFEMSADEVQDIFGIFNESPSDAFE